MVPIILSFSCLRTIAFFFLTNFVLVSIFILVKIAVALALCACFDTFAFLPSRSTYFSLLESNHVPNRAFDKPIYGFRFWLPKHSTSELQRSLCSIVAKGSHFFGKSSPGRACCTVHHFDDHGVFFLREGVACLCFPLNIVHCRSEAVDRRRRGETPGVRWCAGLAGSSFLAYAYEVARPAGTRKTLHVSLVFYKACPKGACSMLAKHSLLHAVPDRLELVGKVRASSFRSVHQKHKVRSNSITQDIDVR